jgi:hypothetical protein
MLGAAQVDWGEVIAALIAGLPAVVAAIFAGLSHRNMRTKSGTPIGQVVESAHAVGTANNQLLQGIAADPSEPPQAPGP